MCGGGAGGGSAAAARRGGRNRRRWLARRRVDGLEDDRARVETSVKQRSACTLGTARMIAPRTVRISLSEKTTFSPPPRRRARRRGGALARRRLELPRSASVGRILRCACSPRRCARQNSRSRPRACRRTRAGRRSLSITCTSCCCRWNSCHRLVVRRAHAVERVRRLMVESCPRAARETERERRRRCALILVGPESARPRRARARAPPPPSPHPSPDSSAPPSDPMSRWNASLT